MRAFIFEDMVTCQYNSLITKLKLVECCFAIDPYIKMMNFSPVSQEEQKKMLSLQIECCRAIY